MLHKLVRLCFTSHMTINTDTTQALDFDLADRLRKALRVSGVTSNEMADHLDVSRNAVSSWINGRNTPRRRDLRDFAMRCGVPLEWLQYGTMPASGPDGDTPTGISGKSRNGNVREVDFGGRIASRELTHAA